MVERPEVVVANEYIESKSSSRYVPGESGVTGGVFGVNFVSCAAVGEDFT